ncbi:DinB family protein [Sorangium cellulosum]|uniref:Damage-inducible protein DinB n=1 Tax=Sorangium cellulosum TaxID=56 RepID=A0A150QMH2_SORCE|nr:DinB family protein [Sorangium cellulosum]KYF69197.1 damage-inducible protein DinB [Sorangium cellulosum]
MSWIEQYRAMARYNRWMNDKIFDVVGKLDDVERKRDRGAFFRSIHGTLNHILLADRTWMGRFTGDVARFTSRDASGKAVEITSLAQELYADFADLTRERAGTDADILAWIHKIDELALSSDLTFKMRNGAVLTYPLWGLVGHFFNHQTHHRGQVTTLLTQMGIDPGVTDLFAMLRDEASAA